MNLTLPVETVKGIGPKTAEKLKKAGIKTIRDLYYYLPRDYENFENATRIANLKPGKITLKAKIRGLTTRRARRRNLTITEAELYDDSGAVKAVWFNQFYREKQFSENKTYFFTGVFEFKNGRYQVTAPSAVQAEQLDDHSSKIHPVYPQKSAIKPQEFAKYIKALRPTFADIPDLLPGIAPKTRGRSLYQAHFPENSQEITSSRQYLAYEELYELILAASLNKTENSRLRAKSLPFSAKNTRELVSSLPFALTNAQKAATWDILQDMGKDTPMNRLLQGDVGAGKTVVAAIAAAQAAQNQAQAALLAPTSILALQHAEGLERLLGPLGLKVALLTGATKHKFELKKRIKSGDIDLVIGTHALLTDDTEFHNLALCIIDEQHRFGVEQRQKLLLKSPSGFAPHLLSMTATPIPRSLQLTIFGDLDVSVISSLPKGRQPIETKILSEINQKTDLYPHIRKTISDGHQVYWICKAIDDNPRTETLSVKKQADILVKAFGGSLSSVSHSDRAEPTGEQERRAPVTTGGADACRERNARKRPVIALLHGRMKPAEKDAIMEQFSSGAIDILVSTTVVEVGVDVPNATDIVIMDAENYGLAQLHQLRGRVGRGSTKSYCFLITSGESAPSRRLRELEKSTNGFHLAEVDLKLRGPGEIYGALQHGALSLKVASLADTKTIAKASKAAKDFTLKLAKTPEIMVKYSELMQDIKKYQQLTTLN